MSLVGGIMAGVGAAGSLGGAALSSSAAGKAANTQAGAAEYAANLQAQQAQEDLNLQGQEYGNAQQISAPSIQGGQSALVNLENLLGISPSTNATTPVYQPQPFSAGTITDPFSGKTIGQPQGPTANYSNYGQPVPLPGSPQSPSPTSRITGPFNYNPNAAATTPTSPIRGGTSSIQSGAPTPSNFSSLSSLVNPSLGATGSLMQPWTGEFQAPTAEQAAQTPGYQFQLQQGEQALENSAASRGNLLSGNTGAALEQYGQGLASTNYQQTYNNTLQQYQQSYNQFQQNQSNQYNRLASLAGLGQVSAGQLTSAGGNAANNSANTLLASGQQIGQNINNAAAATASGYVGSANAYGGALGNIGNNVSGLLGLSSLLNNQNAANAATPTTSAYYS